MADQAILRTASQEEAGSSSASTNGNATKALRSRMGVVAATLAVVGLVCLAGSSMQNNNQKAPSTGRVLFADVLDEKYYPATHAIETMKR